MALAMRTMRRLSGAGSAGALLVVLASDATAASFSYVGVSSGVPNPLSVSGTLQWGCFAPSGEAIDRTTGCSGARGWQVNLPYTSSSSTTTLFPYVVFDTGVVQCMTAFTYNNDGSNYSNASVCSTGATGAAQFYVGAVNVPAAGSALLYANMDVSTTWYSVAYNW